MKGDFIISSQVTIDPDKTGKITFSKPRVEDGRSMWELVQESTLDQNSAYKYIMMSEYFANTCVVAKEDEKLVGFVTAFIPPEKQDVVFVWQIGVNPNYQGKQIASKLLHELINRSTCRNVRYLEATVTPSNKASQALFKGFARKLETNCFISECFSEDLFPSEEHEEELCFRVGPFHT
nr:diaminobutyrate acetyltransferase [Salirhabdus sp. Marseille-P4669]